MSNFKELTFVHRTIWEVTTLNNNFMKRMSLTCAVLVISSLLLIGITHAKSVYLVADHHTSEFDAYGVNTDGTITYQATYNLQCCYDPAGVAIWEKYDENFFLEKAYLFLSSEFCSVIEVFDAVSFTHVDCVSHGGSEVAGLAMDNTNLVLYGIERESNRLFAFDWDPDAVTLTVKAGYPVTLSSVSAAFGLALDSDRGIVYISDTGSGRVRGFDVSVLPGTVSEVFTWQPSSVPVDVDVDEERNILYTTHPDGYCASGQPGGNNYTCKYDITSGIETINSSYPGNSTMGVAVDEVTGYVYLTHGCNASHVSVWDASTSWTQIQVLTGIGNPAGIDIGEQADIPGDPYVKISTNVPDDTCASRREAFTVNVGWGYKDKEGSSLPATGVVACVDLHPHLDYLSSTGGGVYDNTCHCVCWDIGTLQIGDSVVEHISTRVSTGAIPGEVLAIYSEITSAFPDTFDIDQTSVTVCTTRVHFVDLDIKPTSCPNPLNPGANGVLPVAILGTEDFDVSDIDPATLLLEGVSPLRWAYNDVSTPVDTDGGPLSMQRPERRDDGCICGTEGPDGYTDLTLKFDMQEVIAALEPFSRREGRYLEITGQLITGEDLVGEDCVVILFESESQQSETTTALFPPQPNPFNPITRIPYNLGMEVSVKLSIYDVAGRLVERLVDEVQSPGHYIVEWDAGRLASGTYFCRLEAGETVEIQRIVLLK